MCLTEDLVNHKILGSDSSHLMVLVHACSTKWCTVTYFLTDTSTQLTVIQLLFCITMSGLKGVSITLVGICIVDGVAQ